MRAYLCMWATEKAPSKMSCVYRQKCIHVLFRTHTHTHTHKLTYKHMYTHAHKHTAWRSLSLKHTHTHILTLLHEHAHAHLQHTQTHTHKHTHIHTHKHCKTTHCATLKCCRKGKTKKRRGGERKRKRKRKRKREKTRARWITSQWSRRQRRVDIWCNGVRATCREVHIVHIFSTWYLYMISLVQHVMYIQISCKHVMYKRYVQPIADRVAQHLEIISKNF